MRRSRSATQKEKEAIANAVTPDYWRKWKPDPDHINALPIRLRNFIHDLHTRADPAGDVLALHLLKDENAALRALIEKLQRKIQRLERKK